MEAAVEIEKAKHNKASCNQYTLPIRDTLDILNGKWKLPIIGALFMSESRRFKELERDIPKITSRMLSKELKELEMNELVKRTVYDTMPVTVEYEITEYGRSLETVIKALAEWGTTHRKRIIARGRK